MKMISRLLALVGGLLLAAPACTITPITCGGSQPDVCGDYCTNVMTDPNNCGGCGYACGPASGCSGGQCVTGPSGPACVPDGNPCVDNAACCSGVCDPTNVCATAISGCQEDNTPCNVDAECCSNVCAPDGYCGAPACFPEGSGCATDNDCCDPLYCDNGGCSPCVSSGNPCNVDADCCSGVCTAAGCE